MRAHPLVWWIGVLQRTITHVDPQPYSPVGVASKAEAVSVTLPIVALSSVLPHLS